MNHCYTKKKKRNGVRLPTSPDENHQSVSQNHTASELEKKNKFTLFGRVTNLVVQNTKAVVELFLQHHNVTKKFT